MTPGYYFGGSTFLDPPRGLGGFSAAERLSVSERGDTC